MITIEAISAVSGAEWQIGGDRRPRRPPGLEARASADAGRRRSTSLQATQTDAASASQDLATGKATDPTEVVMAVERAQLAMQLAGQIRTKAVEAAQEIFHTQV